MKNDSNEYSRGWLDCEREMELVVERALAEGVRAGKKLCLDSLKTHNRDKSSMGTAIDILEYLCKTNKKEPIAHVLDERIKPFLDAYQSFIDTAHPEIEAMELNVVHPSLKYGGRVDRVYRFPGQIAHVSPRAGLGVLDCTISTVNSLVDAVNELRREQ